MTTLFHDMMHKEIEVYVDDMIAKSSDKEEHIEHLLKLFQRLRKYKLCLNPNKCTFGVRSGKLHQHSLNRKASLYNSMFPRGVMNMVFSISSGAILI